MGIIDDLLIIENEHSRSKLRVSGQTLIHDKFTHTPALSRHPS